MNRGGTRVLWTAVVAACAVWTAPVLAQTAADATQQATPAAQPEAAQPGAAQPATPQPETPSPAPDASGAAAPAEPPAPASADTATQPQPIDGAQANPADLTATATDQPAQETRQRRRRRGPARAMNSISTNVAMMPFGVFTGSFERALTDRFSLNVDAVGAWINKETPRGRTRITGLGLAINFRWFILGKAPAGLFTGPLLRLENLTVRETISGGRGTTGGAGAEIGYSHLFWDRLYLAASGGAEGLVGPVSLNGVQLFGWGWRPFIKANVGVAF